MNLFLYQWLFVILICTKSVHSFDDGAPPGVCGTMMPGHDVSSQPCSANYLIQADKAQYGIGETVRSKYHP